MRLSKLPGRESRFETREFVQHAGGSAAQLPLSALSQGMVQPNPSALEGSLLRAAMEQ